MRNVKAVNTAKIKVAVHLRAAGERVAARGARARSFLEARAAVPPLLGAEERMRERARGAAKRRRMDTEGAASDDGEGTDASLGRGVEEGEELSVDEDKDPQAPLEGAGAGAPKLERPSSSSRTCWSRSARVQVRLRRHGVARRGQAVLQRRHAHSGACH